MKTRPTLAIVDRNAIKVNYIELKKRISKNTNILAVVKANAYGHGAVEVARTLERAGCKFFGVALCEEGIELRESGIKSSIIILGGIYLNQIKYAYEYDLTPVVFDLETAKAIDRLSLRTGKLINIHVKIDTGMGRLGILPQQASQFFKTLQGFDNLNVEGIISHFSEADEEDKEFSKEQLNVFFNIISTVRDIGFKPKLIHIANSAAIVKHADSHFNLVRPGIMLYGAYPGIHMIKNINLKPVMKVVTRIIHVKHVQKGFPVSYGRKYITKKNNSVIAAIPIGYGDGYCRSLSNKGEVLVRGHRAKVAGTICMDITMLDVTSINGVKEGDEVVVIGRQDKNEILVNEVAEKAGTIPYEILCGISSRVPRIYV